MEVLLRYTFLSLFYIHIVLPPVYNSYHDTINIETVNLEYIVTCFAVLNVIEKSSTYFSLRPFAIIFLYGPLRIS